LSKALIKACFATSMELIRDYSKHKDSVNNAEPPKALAAAFLIVKRIWRRMLGRCLWDARIRDIRWLARSSNTTPAKTRRKSAISVCLTSLCGWANSIVRHGGIILSVQSLLQARIFYSWYGSIKCVDRSSQLREWCTLSLVLFMVSRFCPAISLQGLK
jgi:hypothetical protein